MTYTDALFFIGKCLTLGLYPTRIPEVREKIRSGSVEWEQVVWVSTGQFVFAALYLQIKRAGLLPELPADLVEYMEEYTDLNRERNKQIIDEAQKIIILLNDNGICPVFLKGTAHLLDNLYEDIAERVVGDIDFLVDDKDLIITANILLNNGFKKMGQYYPFDFNRITHYPRLINEKLTAAVEIHQQIIKYPFYKSINSKILIANSESLNIKGNALRLNYEQMIIHNILNVQFNDYGYYYGDFFIRQSYDLLLLTKYKNPKNVVKEFRCFFNRMNVNLAWANKLFDNPSCLPYEHTKLSNIFVSRIMWGLNNPRWKSLSTKILESTLFLKKRLLVYFNMIIRSLSEKEVRSYVFSSLGNPKWYKIHFLYYINKNNMNK